MAYAKKTFEQRQNEVNQAFQKIHDAVPGFFESDNFKNYLSTMSKFHNYSVNNIILIHLQKPDATYVAGFNAWKNNFERHVNKGEKAIKVIAPSKYKYKKQIDKVDEDGNVVKDENGNPVKELKEVEGMSFVEVSVFDVSQTSGKELPSLTHDLTSNSKEAQDLLIAAESISDADISFVSQTDDSVLQAGAKGYYDRFSDTIVVNDDMAVDQKAKTLIHEMAHSILHNSDTDKTQEQKEIEAESIAYVVCDYFGLDTSSYSFNYVGAYSLGKSQEELMDILKNIQTTASDLISNLEEGMIRVQEIDKNKETETSKDETSKEEQSGEGISEENTEQKDDKEAVSTGEVMQPENTESIEESSNEDNTETEEIESEEQDEQNSSTSEQSESSTNSTNKSTNKIEDFGEKIGGARKDLWKENGGLSIDDLEGLTNAEKLQYINKNNIFPKPDYKYLVEQGVDKVQAYYIKCIRDVLPTKPFYSRLDKTPEQIEVKQKAYIEFVSDIRNKIIYSLNWDKKAPDLSGVIEENYTERVGSHSLQPLPEYQGLITNKMFKLFENPDFYHMSLEVQRKQFCYSDAEKIVDKFKIKHDYDKNTTKVFDPEGKEILNYSTITSISDVKKAALEIVNNNFDEYSKFLDKPKEKTKTDGEKDILGKTGLRTDYAPKMLSGIEREGPEVRNDNVKPEDLMDTFGFKGGEFGNWLNEKERQASLNFAYDSFKDIATALNIPDKDTTFEGDLSIAFGSRGHSKALAHYEPSRDVINLTKMKGAGSLAHEWTHALDDYLGKKYGFDGLLSKQLSKDQPEAFKKLIKTLKTKMPTAEEVKQSAMKDKEELSIKFKQDLYSICIKAKDPELIKQQDKLIDAIVEEAKNTTDYSCRDIVNKNGRPVIVSDEKSSPAFSDFIEFQKEKLNDKNPVKNIRWCNSRRDRFSRINDEIKNPENNISEIPTDFMKAATKFDDGKKTPYWSSDCELLARAGAAYIKDKLEEQGIKNDYLCGHADTAPISGYYLSPQGEEREAINEAFDTFFEELKELDMLHEQNQDFSSLDSKLETAQQKAASQCINKDKKSHDEPTL